MLSLALLVLFVVLLCLYFRKSSKVEETLILVNEYRDHPFALQIRWKPKGHKQFNDWRHLDGFTYESDRKARYERMTAKGWTEVQVRMVNYRRIYPRAG